MNLTKSKLSKCSVLYASHIQLENAAYIILVSIVLQSMLEHAEMYDGDNNAYYMNIYAHNRVFYVQE